MSDETERKHLLENSEGRSRKIIRGFDESSERRRANALGTGLTMENVRLASELEALTVERDALGAEKKVAMKACDNYLKKLNLVEGHMNSLIVERKKSNEEKIIFRAKLAMVSEVATKYAEYDYCGDNSAMMAEGEAQEILEILSTAPEVLAVYTGNFCKECYCIHSFCGCGDETAEVGATFTITISREAREHE